ncbi:MFS general substrate transporter [Marasmius fiardii PR-910]|nr:MFS general substrate transporter [Marasmius fiardii PR-910]
MASITPRASGFWQDRMSYFDDDDPEEQRLMGDENDDENGLNDGRTRLDKTIDRIGMGSYQWTLLSLCGLGWMADNMWIQTVAIILPRVQQHYSVSDSLIGVLSSSMFAGMMVGAVGWGTCSDMIGRSAAFNATLFFTAVFGIVSTFTTSFFGLCVTLFFLGSSVGGSMPTDGTLLLEHMPNGKKYLVTALSVFFSFGAVLSAVVALLVVPKNTCPREVDDCDVNSQNMGWKYLLTALGIITLVMFLARIVFFRLHESPRYLVGAGRHQEALESLQMISRFNGSDLSLALEDVYDGPPKPQSPSNSTKPEGTPEMSRSNTSGSGESGGSDGVANYSSVSATRTSLGSHTFQTPTVTPSVEHHEPAFATAEQTASDNVDSTKDSPTTPTPRPRPRLQQQQRRLSRRASSVYEKKMCSALPRWLRRPLWAWWDRVMMVLAPEWLRTTILVWSVWFSMSLAYTMFNVYLPKLLETPSASAVGTRDEQTAAPMKSVEESLWDVVIFTIGGCPGAILGAYMTESSLGRRWSLAGTTFLTAFFCVVFIEVQASWAVRASSVGISLSATAMYSVLYGWTPDIFGTEVRGTACGIASALSRIGGMIAPILGGILLVMSRSIPVYTSVVVYILSGLGVLMLKENAGNFSKGQTGVVH